MKKFLFTAILILIGMSSLSNAQSGYTVVLGSSTNPDMALKLKDRLSNLGISVYLMEATINIGKTYRVCSGFFTDVNPAYSERNRLVQITGITDAWLNITDAAEYNRLSGNTSNSLPDETPVVQNDPEPEINPNLLEPGPVVIEPENEPVEVVTESNESENTPVEENVEEPTNNEPIEETVTSEPVEETNTTEPEETGEAEINESEIPTTGEAEISEPEIPTTGEAEINEPEIPTTGEEEVTIPPVESNEPEVITTEPEDNTNQPVEQEEVIKYQALERMFPGFSSVYETFTEAIATKDRAKLGSIVFSELGLLELSNPGLFISVFDYKDVDLAYKMGMKLTYQDCSPVIESLPVYDCRSKKWNKEGCYVTEALNYEKITNAIKNSQKFMKYNSEQLGKFLAVESNIKLSVVQTNGVKADFMLMNGKWYLAVIDNIDPCNIFE
ncbi:MAG: SPOR domain-containing protein [Ignavibacteriaceae bacterium]|nr:SPOR domain-containing protein [Ignavibacteriaceae bacterium]